MDDDVSMFPQNSDGPVSPEEQTLFNTLFNFCNDEEPSCTLSDVENSPSSKIYPQDSTINQQSLKMALAMSKEASPVLNKAHTSIIPAKNGALNNSTIANEQAFSPAQFEQVYEQNANAHFKLNSMPPIGGQFQLNEHNMSAPLNFNNMPALGGPVQLNEEVTHSPAHSRKSSASNMAMTPPQAQAGFNTYPSPQSDNNGTFNAHSNSDGTITELGKTQVFLKVRYGIDPDTINKPESVTASLTGDYNTDITALAQKADTIQDALALVDILTNRQEKKFGDFQDMTNDRMVTVSNKLARLFTGLNTANKDIIAQQKNQVSLKSNFQQVYDRQKRTDWEVEQLQTFKQQNRSDFDEMKAMLSKIQGEVAGLNQRTNTLWGWVQQIFGFLRGGQK